MGILDLLLDLVEEFVSKYVFGRHSLVYLGLVEPMLNPKLDRAVCLLEWRVLWDM